MSDRTVIARVPALGSQLRACCLLCTLQTGETLRFVLYHPRVRTSPQMVDVSIAARTKQHFSTAPHLRALVVPCLDLLHRLHLVLLVCPNCRDFDRHQVSQKTVGEPRLPALRRFFITPRWALSNLT